MTASDGIVIAAREIDTSRVVIWTATARDGHTLLLTAVERPEPGQDPYFFDAQGEAEHRSSGGSR